MIIYIEKIRFIEEFVGKLFFNRLYYQSYSDEDLCF